MGTDNLVRFLTTLSTDPILAAAFKQNADTVLVLANSSLSPEEKDVLKIGDPEKIHEILSTNCEKWATPIVVSPSSVKQCTPVVYRTPVVRRSNI